MVFFEMGICLSGVLVLFSGFKYLQIARASRALLTESYQGVYPKSYQENHSAFWIPVLLRVHFMLPKFWFFLIPNFFYNLIILTKLCKIWKLNLDKALLFQRNQVISEKLKTLTSSNYHKVYHFLLEFCTRFLLKNVYKWVFEIFFILFRSWFINENVKN